MPRGDMMAIRRGICRTVLLTRRWAIKVPSLRTHGDGPKGALWSLCRGALANQSELQWSGSDGFCPVRWTIAGIINVYPRCEPVPDYTGDYSEISGCLPTGAGDRKPENIGRLNGRIVWIDYDMSWNGCPHDREVVRLGDEEGAA